MREDVFVGGVGVSVGVGVGAGVDADASVFGCYAWVNPRAVMQTARSCDRGRVFFADTGICAWQVLC